jgi:aminoglycoside phosphotransferase (APT) family kinase protein
MTSPGQTDPGPLSEEQIRRTIAAVSPGGALIAVRPLPRSDSNFTDLVEARSAGGAPLWLVLRRYAVFGGYDRGLKAEREYRTLALLAGRGLPVPRPLLLDQGGELLGAPGIVTEYIPGAPIESPRHPAAWAKNLALTLARIHAVSCDAGDPAFLLDANAEATWFLRAPSLPEYMAAHPRGPEVWRALRQARPQLAPAPSRLVHLDYWPGNILWRNEQIVGVVDWEEAACGDPAIDVAYCRLELSLRGMDGMAELFLRSYEAAAGHPVENLGFWELAAAVRPMVSPAGWIDEHPAAERFSRFVHEARSRLPSQL